MKLVKHYWWSHGTTMCLGIGGVFAPKAGSWHGVTCKKCLALHNTSGILNKRGVSHKPRKNSGDRAARKTAKRILNYPDLCPRCFGSAVTVKASIERGIAQSKAGKVRRKVRRIK